MGKDLAILGVTAAVLGDWWGDLAGVITIILGPVCGMVSLVFLIAAHHTLQKVLYRVRPSNRLMEPGSVWLNLIPVFGFIWSFFMATRIPESLRKEFRDRGQDDGSDYGKGIGLAYATTYATVGALWFPMRMIPIRMIPISRPELLGIPWAVLGLSSFVLFLMFAVKIARYGDRLGAP